MKKDDYFQKRNSSSIDNYAFTKGKLIEENNYYASKDEESYFKSNKIFTKSIDNGFNYQR